MTCLRIVSGISVPWPEEEAIEGSRPVLSSIILQDSTFGRIGRVPVSGLAFAKGLKNSTLPNGQREDEVPFHLKAKMRQITVSIQNTAVGVQKDLCALSYVTTLRGCTGA